MENLRKTWEFLILVLCATGISGGSAVQPEKWNRMIDVMRDENNKSEKVGEAAAAAGAPILRFACPVGFFRLNRKCYYLSGGSANWQQAHFHCKDRNSTLAAPEKKGTDRKLRKYLMGEQFAQLERWIGGIYDWHRMAWKWGVSGEKILFNHFEGAISNGNDDYYDDDDENNNNNRQEYAWHCILMDPRINYKWRPTSCVEKKHYICQVPAGRIGRRRRYGGIEDDDVDAKTPRKEGIRQRKKPLKYNRKKEAGVKRSRRPRIKTEWKRDGLIQDSINNQWANGVRPGWGDILPESSRNGTRTRGNRKRHRSSSKVNPDKKKRKLAEKISGARRRPQDQEYGAYSLGEYGPARTQSLAENPVFNKFQTNLNDLSLEEILLKT